jgi:hypothetical protein
MSHSLRVNKGDKKIDGAAANAAFLLFCLFDINSTKAIALISLFSVFFKISNIPF